MQLHHTVVSPSLPWLKHYESTVPFCIKDKLGKNLVEILDQSCQRFATNDCLISLGGRLSYQQLYRYSYIFSAWLHQQGLKKGDRVVLIMPNLMQFVVAMLGILRAGGIVVMCNPLSTEDELSALLQDAQPSFIFIAQPLAAKLKQIALPTSVHQVIVTRLGDMQPFGRKLLIHFYAYLKQFGFATKNVYKKILSNTKLNQQKPRNKKIKIAQFHAILNKNKHLQMPPVVIKASDPAFLLYTGGTTAKPKGVLLSHKNMVANLYQVQAWVESSLQLGKETVLTALPMYHVFSLTGNCLLFLKLGGRNILIPDARNIHDVIRAFQQYEVNAFTGVNRLFKRLLQMPEFSQCNFSHLKVVIGGGSAIEPHVSKRWQAVTKRPLWQAYGLTETAPAVCMNPFNENHKHDALGLPLPSTQVVIFDNKGNHLKSGQVGEIGVQGPQVMKGYYQNKTLTRKAFTEDGFFRTGDIGFMDKQGFVFLVDRKDDVINVSGFNVYPSEIEATIMQIKGVQACAAVGVPCEYTGQSIKVFIQTSHSGLSTKFVVQHCQKKLTNYKVPSEVVFCSQLPLSLLGKVLRRKLR